MAPTLAKYQLYGIRHTYIVYNNSGAYGYKRVYLTKEDEVKINNAQLEFSGDGQKFKRPYGYEAEGTVTADVDDNQLDGILWPTVAVSPVGGDDFAVRYIKGGNAELQTSFAEVRISIDGEDADSGAPIVLRFRILKCQFNPDNPGKVATQAIASRMISWNWRRTNVDIIGAAPTGMPANGCYWLKDWITNANNFDPVPGDVL